ARGQAPGPSILDQAASSTNFSKHLTADYESSTNGFEGDRLLAVGIAYLVLDQFDRALPIYERFLRQNPDNTRALRGMGSVCFNLKRYHQAIECFRKAWDKGDIDSLAGLAGTYVNLGQFDDIKDLIPALSSNKRAHPIIVDCLLSYVLTKD